MKKKKENMWELIQSDYDLWTSMEGCKLQDKWLYEALLNLNKRIKQLERKC